MFARCLLACALAGCGGSNDDSMQTENGAMMGGGTGGSGGGTEVGVGGGAAVLPPNTMGGVTGGASGTPGMLGLGGMSGTGTSGTGASAASDEGAAAGVVAVSGDDLVSDVKIEVLPDVKTILVVTWTQTMDATSSWLEFSFEPGNTMTSRPQPGTAGTHRDVVLGVPGETMVTVRIVSEIDGMQLKSKDYQATTGAVPSGMPTPTIVKYDPELASADRWLFGAVEDSLGGCNNQSCYYNATFWVYIMDRKGRIVWYYADPVSNATSSFQRRARDGEYIWIEKRPFGGAGQRGVLKTTLDHAYSEEIPVPNLSDCIDVTDDGSLLFDVTRTYELREMTKDGKFRTIWSCPDHFGRNFQCYSNTINWNPSDDSVMLSFPEERTVIQIDRKTGDVVGQYGAASGSYAFSPSTWSFNYQHFANISRDGTLMVSSHMPGYQDTEMPVAGQHAFIEFTIDRVNRQLVEKWVYNEGQEWAMYKGMAIRMANGNTLANYGTGGVIREITPDKQTAFEVKFDSTRGSNDFFNKMVGNNELIDDLYALNGGGPQ